MKSYKLSSILVFLALTISFGFLSIQKAEASDEIRIGFICGLTGYMAYDCARSVMGMKLKLEEVGYQWMGKKIKVIWEDNASDTIKSIDKARKLVEHNKVHLIIGPMASAFQVATINYLQRSNTPWMPLYTTPSEIIKMDAENLFGWVGENSSYMTSLADYLGENGYKTAVALYFEDPTGDEMFAAFKKRFKKFGGTLIEAVPVSYDVMDFSPYLSAMKKADVAFGWFFGPQGTAFMKQYFSGRKKMPLVLPMGPAIANSVTLEEIGDDCIGMIGSEFYGTLLNNERNRKFFKQFMEKNNTPPITNDFIGYSSVELYLEALKKTNGDTSFDKINETMRGIELETPAGVYKMDSRGIGSGPITVFRTVKLSDRYDWLPVATYDTGELR
jgi:branched-chain amino acid transport system substrate-binding protein